jgi:hypothetical protein
VGRGAAGKGVSALAGGLRRAVLPLLRPGAEAALIDLVRADGGWEEVYADDHAVAFVPRP